MMTRGYTTTVDSEDAPIQLTLRQKTRIWLLVFLVVLAGIAIYQVSYSAVLTVEYWFTDVSPTWAEWRQYQVDSRSDFVTTGSIKEMRSITSDVVNTYFVVSTEHGDITFHEQGLSCQLAFSDVGDQISITHDLIRPWDDVVQVISFQNQSVTECK